MTDMAEGTWALFKRTMMHDSRPDYWIEMDEYRDADKHQCFIMHARFGKFTSSIYKSFLKAVQRLINLNLGLPVFCIPLDEQDPNKHADAKYLKFISRIGFKPIGIFAGAHQFYRLDHGHLNAEHPRDDFRVD